MSSGAEPPGGREEWQRVTGGGTPSAGTNGFLFCDLRGYTAFVERNGDQAAAELLARYRTLVRAVIADHAGAEIKTEGDSVYVVFPAASAAVEAGLAIVAAAGSDASSGAPIRVGVGIHAGETVATTEGLVGGAVNIAARVCAKARAGEVVVTDTVRALTRTFLPYRYTSLGTQTLKGIAGGIPLYRVEAVPASARARLARQLGARRGRLALVAGLVVVALVASGGAYAVNRPADCLSLPASTHDVVAKIDPARNCVVASYPVGQRPGAVVVADNRIWVADVDDHAISVVDPASGLVHTTGAMGTPIALAAGPGAVYALTVEHTIADLSLRTSTASGSFELPVPPGAELGSVGYTDLTVGAGKVWVSNAITGDLIPVSPSSGAAGASLHLADPSTLEQGPFTGALFTGIEAVATAGGTIFVADRFEPRYFRVDPGSSRPSQASTDPEHGGAIAIAPASDALWLLHSDGYVTRIDAGTGAATSYNVAGGAGDLAVGSTAVWVINPVQSDVVRIDTTTGQTIATVPVGGHPAGVAVAPDGSAWITIAAP